MFYLIFGAVAVFALIVGYVLLIKSWDAKHPESIDPPVAEAKDISVRLSKLAVGLVVSKYCGLVCNQISEIKINFSRDIEEIALKTLLHESAFFMNHAEFFARQISDSLTEHFTETLTVPDCENCEKRASELQQDAEAIIFDILVFKNA